VLKGHCALTSLLTTGHIIYYDAEGEHDISVTKGGVAAVANDEVKVLLH
jgi:F0F1-type ATP synthase epsilon subunit